MSSLTIEEDLTVQASPERVFQYLLTPEEVVTCLPGAELDKVEDARTFYGNIKVKVGPVAIGYAGKAVLTEVDHDARCVTMVGEGKEKGGAGVVKMTMKSVVEPEGDGGSKVNVHADVQLAGKVVRFGRGMIQGVSAQLFKEFGDRLRGNLERGPAEEGGDGKALQSTPAAAPVARGEAVNLVALFFRALWAGIKAFFNRLLRKKQPG